MANDIFMTPTSYTLFDTSLGQCGIAWKAVGDSDTDLRVVFFQLPEATNEAAEARIAHKSGAGKSLKLPAPIVQIVERVRKHLDGEIQDFRDIPVDLSGMDTFALQVYEISREIPPGRITTYGELAARLGNPGAARAVGRALGDNPIPLIIPCHRILAAGSKTGGFSAHGGRATKTKLLSIEGVAIEPPLFP
jgi:O-6-methylguanine DNA methyltransferase